MESRESKVFKDLKARLEQRVKLDPLVQMVIRAKLVWLDKEENKEKMDLLANRGKQDIQAKLDLQVNKDYKELEERLVILVLKAIQE